MGCPAGKTEMNEENGGTGVIEPPDQDEGIRDPEELRTEVEKTHELAREARRAALEQQETANEVRNRAIREMPGHIEDAAKVRQEIDQAVLEYMKQVAMEAEARAQESVAEAMTAGFHARAAELEWENNPNRGNAVRRAEESLRSRLRWIRAESLQDQANAAWAALAKEQETQQQSAVEGEQ